MTPSTSTSALSQKRKTGTMDFDWGVYLCVMKRSHAEDCRAYAEIVALVLRELRRIDIRTPSWLLDDVDESARWIAREEGTPPPLVLAVRGVWEQAARAVGYKGDAPLVMPPLTEVFFRVADEVFMRMFESKRQLRLVAAAQRDPEHFRGFLRRFVHNLLLDMLHALNPRAYNVYENTRWALGYAWIVGQSLKSLDGQPPPVPKKEGRLPPSRVIFPLEFVRSKTSLRDKKDVSRRLDDGAVLGRLDDFLCNSPTRARSLQERLGKDSDSVRADLAYLLPELLGTDSAFGSTFKKAFLVWAVRDGDASGPSSNSDPPDGGPSLDSLPDEGADPSSGACLADRFRQIELRLASLKVPPSHRVGFQILIDHLREHLEVLTVDALCDKHNQINPENKIARATAGEIRQAFTVEARNGLL